MLYNRNNLLINSIAAKDDRRPELQGVLFQYDRTIATDSYALIQVVNPHEMIAQITNVPKTKYGNAMRGMDKKGIRVPIREVIDLERHLNENKVPSSMPILENCWLVKPTTFMVKDLGREKIVDFRPYREKYPDVSRIIPKRNDTSYKWVRIDVKRLKTIIDTLAKMDLSGLNSVDLGINRHNDYKPIALHAFTKQNQEVTGVLMPVM